VDRSRKAEAQFACIDVAGSRTILPSDDAYERQLVAEHVQAAGAAHGDVIVRIDGRTWHVVGRSADESACANCRNRIAGASYLSRGATMCAGCGGRQLFAA
jgi:hypothetical protein